MIERPDEQNEKIIRIARMILDDLQPSDEAEFGRAFSQLDNVSTGLVRFAVKIMEGKPFAVDSDNPKTISRYRSFAAQLSASVETFKEYGGRTRIVFRPARRDPLEAA